VAEEVRKLAQRSAQAARDTAPLIQESMAKSDAGRDRLFQITEVVNSITGSATKARTLVDQVKTGSEQQALGITEVARAVRKMQSMMQTTAANSEECAAASEQLSAQAEMMNEIASNLRSMVEG
jgi:methyl-accepting chemotaxis protein